MGGYGSTRWVWHTKKATVDESRTLSIFELKRKEVLRPKSRRWGSWQWWNTYSGERTADIGYELNTIDDVPYFRIYYAITGWDGNKKNFDYQIRLQATPCQFGGARWWFVCPLSENGRSCEKRVAKLFLPPGGRYFGCRHCHHLTYRSSQESDKRVSALRSLDPLAILNGINDGKIDFLMGLKALPDEVWQQ